MRCLIILSVILAGCSPHQGSPRGQAVQLCTDSGLRGGALEKCVNENQANFSYSQPQPMYQPVYVQRPAFQPYYLPPVQPMDFGNSKSSSCISYVSGGQLITNCN